MFSWTLRHVGSVAATALCPLLVGAAAFAFDFSSPLQDVQTSLAGNTITYRVLDPARGFRDGSWTGSGGFISQPTTSGGVVAWLAGSTVYYRIYDPGLGSWREGSNSSPAGVYVTEPKNQAGVVAWIAGTTVLYRAYDPVTANWKGGSSGSAPGTIISDPINRDGVVAWVAGSTVQYRAYDPNLAAWREGSNATPGVIISDPANSGGVVAWTAGNAVYYRIYDAGRTAWKTGSWSGTGEYISSPLVSNSTVTWTAGSSNYVRGYNQTNGTWFSGATLPYASFAASPLSGNAPLFVWFSDLSFGATIWTWNFGDGGVSAQRVPYHIFAGFARFNVALTVTGPAGNHSTSTNIQADVSPPAGSVLVDDGAAYTRTNLVALTLSATDNSGGPLLMRFSNTGSTWSNWVAYAASFPWRLLPGDGLKIVYAQFKDAADNVSPAYSDTITLDTRPLPAVSLNINSVVVSEGVPLVTFTVALSSPSVFPATVSYATGGGSASAGSDYSGLNGTLTFAPGETNKILSLAILNDALVETNEAFQLVLSNPANAVPGQYPAATITILDNDPPLVSFLSSTVSVEESGGHAVISVGLNAPSGLTVSVDYATTNGTAKAGTDYAAVAGTLIFTPGQTTRTFNVPMLDDSVDETDETILLQLRNLTNSLPGSIPSATLTILDDDLPKVNFSSSQFFVNEATSNAVIGVRLSTPYAETVYVSYSTANGTATSDSDYLTASGTLTFSPGQTNKTFEVTILNDGLEETNETIQLRFTGMVNAVVGSVSTAVLTLLDNNGRPVLFSARIAPVGYFRVSLFGQIGRTYAMEVSSNLTSWLELARGTNFTGQLDWTDPATNRWRFYRARQVE